SIMEAFVSIDHAHHFVVLKTLPGNAQAIVALIDDLDWDGILGTICGDDTCLIICRTEENAVEIENRFLNMLYFAHFNRGECYIITELSNRNFAIIDDISITFHDSITVLTGETGAGKSIIIDAVQLIAGERGSVEYVRHGADKAEITALFSIESDHQRVHS